MTEEISNIKTQTSQAESLSTTVSGLLVPVSSSEAQGVIIDDYLSIGTDPSNRMQIMGERISPQHARIEKRGRLHYLRDQRSESGLFVNEVRILECILTDGDIVRIGDLEFFYRQPHSTPQLPRELSSKNKKFQEELGRVPKIARTEFPVVLTGPSGCGKEVLAKTIHELSQRNRGPFVAVNCSALQSTLIESELFGHVRGSFTGATHDRKGAFESARGGTLFLDEIGDLPIDLQPKLLRALENQEIRPVGADRTIQTNIRLVCATHKDLRAKVETGEFREDLFHRIHVIWMRIPSLQERFEDIEFFIIHFSKMFRVRLSILAIRKLQEYSWPGNLRELRNTIARLSAYFPGEYIQPEQVSTILPLTEDGAAAGTTTLPPAGVDANGLSVIKEIERELIIKRLIANAGSQRKTASDLGMPKSTLHDRLRTYNIRIDDIVKRKRDRIPEEVPT